MSISAFSFGLLFANQLLTSCVLAILHARRFLNNRLLRSTRILILDEATSSTDMETDAMVQRVIRTALKDSIVICIAHRLKSIIDYDRVVVMQDGKLVENGSPKE